MLIFFSCVSLSSLSFSSIETVEPVWQPLAEGVSFFQGRITNPQLEFFALRVDLASAGIRIVAGSGTNSTRVSSFVRNNNLLAGINAVPFDVITSREGQPVRNMGIVISNGVIISSANPNYDALVFFRNSAAIVSQSSIRLIENIENAVGGFHQILTDGEPAQRTLSRSERHPRSAAGISVNGNILYLLVIDGRRAASIGGTERETAVLLRSLGSWNGINLDGGGSSALALRYPDGTVRTINSPVHSGIPGMERAVAGCLGIGLR